VYFDGAFRSTAIYNRAQLRAGNRIIGPALIEEHASTTVLADGDRLEVDQYGNLLIEARSSRAARA
jgi:N-methylhydantoinase A